MTALFVGVGFSVRTALLVGVGFSVRTALFASLHHPSISSALGLFLRVRVRNEVLRRNQET